MGSSHCLTDHMTLVALTWRTLSWFSLLCAIGTQNPKDFGMGWEGIKGDLSSSHCNLCVHYAKV